MLRLFETIIKRGRNPVPRTNSSALQNCTAQTPTRKDTSSQWFCTKSIYTAALQTVRNGAFTQKGRPAAPWQGFGCNMGSGWVGRNQSIQLNSIQKWNTPRKAYWIAAFKLELFLMDGYSEEKKKGRPLRTEPPKAKEVHSHKTWQGLQCHSTRHHPCVGQVCSSRRFFSSLLTHNNRWQLWQRCSADELWLQALQHSTYTWANKQNMLCVRKCSKQQLLRQPFHWAPAEHQLCLKIPHHIR